MQARDTRWILAGLILVMTLGEAGQAPAPALALPASGRAQEASAQFAGSWRPDRVGDYLVAIVASGTDDKGNPFERLAILAVQVE